ncbi:unnamed protein product [Amoebophrya sp. A120]|nr:unnamed protein product [Amoebophrya sp. A120]|eukprot:GSA120T00010478001.1
MAQVFQMFQLTLFFLVFAGEMLFEKMLKLPIPGLVQALSGNKMASFMIIWLFGNVAASAFLQTGAFEIYYQDKVAWSSLANNHRMPNYHDIFYGCKRVGLELMQSAVP